MNSTKSKKVRNKSGLRTSRVFVTPEERTYRMKARAVNADVLRDVVFKLLPPITDAKKTHHAEEGPKNRQKYQIEMIRALSAWFHVMGSVLPMRSTLHAGFEIDPREARLGGWRYNVMSAGNLCKEAVVEAYKLDLDLELRYTLAESVDERVRANIKNAEDSGIDLLPSRSNQTSLCLSTKPVAETDAMNQPRYVIETFDVKSEAPASEEPDHIQKALAKLLDSLPPPAVRGKRTDASYHRRMIDAANMYYRICGRHPVRTDSDPRVARIANYRKNNMYPARSPEETSKPQDEKAPEQVLITTENDRGIVGADRVREVLLARVQASATQVVEHVTQSLLDCAASGKTPAYELRFEEMAKSGIHVTPAVVSAVTDQLVKLLYEVQDLDSDTDNQGMNLLITVKI